MPNKITILALASAAAALATAASAVAEEYGGGGGGECAAAPTAPAAPAADEPAPKTRGKAAPKAAAAGKTFDDLKEIIAPLVKGIPGVLPGAGAKIKEINKEQFGIDALKDLPAEKQEEWLAAIKPLQDAYDAASI